MYVTLVLPKLLFAFEGTSSVVLKKAFDSASMPGHLSCRTAPPFRNVIV